jgi:hypothetical protein
VQRRRGRINPDSRIPESMQAVGDLVKSPKFRCFP